MSRFALSGPTARNVGALAVAVAIAAVGGTLFTAMDLPAGWLSGSMVPVAAVAMFGLRARVPTRLREAVFVVLGISMGSGVTPDVVSQISTWPVTMLGLLVTMVLVTASSYAYLRLVAGWDPASAYFGSIPGALSMTLAVAEDSPADLRRVSLAQAMRLLMLVAVLPLAISSIEAPSESRQAADVLTDPFMLAVLIAAGLGGSVLAMAIRMPSGVLLGAFFASSLLHGFGIIEGRIPAAVQVPAFVALGTILGLRFAGTTWRQFAAMLGAGVGAFVTATTVASLGAITAAAVAGVPLGQVLLAFAPGGLEAMIILAFVLAVDPAFVAAHHLARFLFMTVAVPVVAPLVYGRRGLPSTKDKPAE